MSKNKNTGLFLTGIVFILGSPIGWALISPISESESMRIICVSLFIFGLICVGVAIYNLINKKRR